MGVQLGLQLRRARTAAGLSQAKVGEMMGVSRVTYHNWEAGKSTPTRDMVVRLALALGTSPEVLLSPATNAHEPMGQQDVSANLIAARLAPPVRTWLYRFLGDLAGAGCSEVELDEVRLYLSNRVLPAYAVEGPHALTPDEQIKALQGAAESVIVPMLARRGRTVAVPQRLAVAR